MEQFQAIENIENVATGNFGSLSKEKKSVSPLNHECKCFNDPKLRKRKNHRDHFPFLSIYEKNHECRSNGYLLRGVPIDVEIKKVKEDPAVIGYFSDPVSYIINIKHGKHEWQDEKRWIDFVILDKRLKAHRLKKRFSRPFKRRKKNLKNELLPDDHNYGMRHRRGCPLRWSIDSDEYDMSTLEEEISPELNNLALLPQFPAVPKDRVTERKMKLESWLQHVLHIPDIKSFNETTKFLDISRFSFIKGIGKKSHEGVVRKRLAVGGEVNMDCSQMCLHYFIPKIKRWLVIKDSYLFYTDLQKEVIRLVILLDEKFKVKPRDLGLAGFSPTEFALVNEDFKLYIKCNRKEDAVQWKLAIRDITHTTGAIWLEHKRFKSTYPVRNEENFCQTFVDGCDYWSRVADMMEQAREEIYIGHWWLSPESYLKKPIHHGSKWRLDHILKRAAERGVRVFVLLFKEFSQGMCSKYCKRTLQGLHENIKVIRHPDHKLGSATFLWTHHEKFIVVDQLIAFVGGIDLTYGRWDDYRHVLGDLGYVDTLSHANEETENKPIEAALTSAVEAATKAIIADTNLQELRKNKKKPRRKVELLYLTIGGECLEKDTFLIKQSKENERRSFKLSKLKGLKDIVGEDLIEVPIDGIEFEEETSFMNSDKDTLLTPLDSTGKKEIGGTQKSEISKTSKILANSIIQAYHQAIPEGTDLIRVSVINPDPYEIHETTAKSFGGTHSHSKNPFRRLYENVMIMLRRLRFSPESKTIEEYVINFYTIQKQAIDIGKKENAGKSFPGKDYVNFIFKDIVDADDAFSDFTDRYNVPRMPWHDSQSATYGEAARDVARHFIQRWNAAKREKLRNNDAYPYLIPKSYDNIRVPSAIITNDMYKTEVQVLRSVTRWSALTDKTEDSIQQAYISLMANAKHYIYIENQFFVSMINNADVSNEINRTICDRIIKAHRNDEAFRVYIVLPLLPAMEADIKSSQYNVMLTMLSFLYSSLSRGSYSMLGFLKEAGIEDPFKYLCFTSLRTHDELAGKLLSELVYIHSKFMIIDDLHVINSSANINDRSLVGDRDSELALCITDTEFIKTKMNGEDFYAGRHAYALRMRCMKEHLGMLPGQRCPPKEEIDCSDPVIESFFQGVWRKIAENNTKVYEEVFMPIPTDKVKTLSELEEWTKETPLSTSDPKAALERLKEVTGQLVSFPLDFLDKENIKPTDYLFTPQAHAPTALFV
uniref:Phospholipase n=1 Tax=Panagrolaimus sp. ES5 TaxID=591445 RepID=A0AC34GX80_9BILA